MIRGRALSRLPFDASIEMSISDFGPISSGKFAIKPLTIFVGPNNSGKTYAATLAHSLLSSYGRRSSPWDIANLIKPHLKSKHFQSIISIMEKLVSSSDNDEPVPIPAQCSNAASDILLEAPLKHRILETIQNNFGTDPKNLVRFSTKHSYIDMSYNLNTRLTLYKDKDPVLKLHPITHTYVLRNYDDVVQVYRDPQDKKPHADVTPMPRTHAYVRHVLDIIGENANLGLRAFLTLALKIESHYLRYPPRSCYLPAARAGILSAYETIVSSVMQNAQYAGTQPFKIEQLSGTTSDFITQLININTGRPQRPRNGNSIIEEMFGGSIVLSKPRTGIPKIIYRSFGTNIPMNRSSSGITETASLQILQNHMPHYDVLFLEEPEAHLHPENQTKLAKHIIRLVKSGTRVILITHGVFFLEQLSMFVRMSKISPSERKELGYEENDFIDNNDVAPYLFKRDGEHKYSIHELTHSADEGIRQDEFINVTESMYAKDVKIDQFLESQ